MSEHAKAYLLQLLSEDPLNQHTWHYFPHPKYIKALLHLEVLENLAVNFIKNDKDGVPVAEILADEPKRENFSSEQDYQNAYFHYKKLVSMLDVVKKVKGNIDPHELVYVVEWIKALKSAIYASNSLKGHRINLMVTERREMKASIPKQAMKLFREED